MTKADLAVFQILISILLLVLSLISGILLWRRGQQTRNQTRRIQAIALSSAGVTGVAVLALPSLAYLYTELLWHESVQYDRIFLSLLHLKWFKLLAKYLLISIAFIGVNCFAAHFFCPISSEFGRWTRARTHHFYIIIVIIVGLVSIVLATPMVLLWDHFLRFEYGSPTNDVDPIFQQQISYFLFRFPADKIQNIWWRLLMWSNLVIMGLLYHFYYRRDPHTMARIQLRLASHGTVLWLMLLGLSFWGCQLGIWKTLFTFKVPWGLGRIDGFGFVDDKLIQVYKIHRIVICTIGAGLVVNLMLRKRWVWYAAGLTWGLSHLILIQVYPMVVHLVKERRDPHIEVPYFDNHIQSTRKAFALDRIELRTEQVKGNATLDLIERHPEVKENIQIWDRRVLYEVLTEHPQRLMPYFQFHPYTDVDRYRINGRLRQVLVAAREIDSSQLPAEAQDWVHRKLIYTHGYGVCVVPVNEFQQKDPVFWVRGMKKAADKWQTVSKDGFPLVRQPQIYYGELTRNYVIVGTTRDEVDLENQNYQGKGGVRLNNWIRRFCFALRFDFWRIMLSKDIDPKTSRIMLWRKIGTKEVNSPKTIVDRVSHIAPFFKYDPDPYIVVGNDGQLWWIIDLYLTSQTYPNAKTYVDQTELIETYSEPTFDKYNYIRNPAVAVVNAYNGQVDFYFTKEVNEPLSLAYQKAFANTTNKGNNPLFKTRQEMPTGLQYHLRYPDYLTKVQAEIYKDYHVIDSHPDSYSTIFFQGSDKWEIPKEKYGQNRSYESMMPYYVTIRLPDSSDPDHHNQVEFVNMIPFTPPERVRYMNAWMVARCDRDHYGQLVLYNLPKDEPIPGPTLVEGTIETELSQDLTLWNQQGTTVIRGNLLVIPVGNTLFYIEPIYLKPENVARPDLQVVTVQAGGEFASASDFDSALRQIYGVGIAKKKREQTENGLEIKSPFNLDTLIQSASENYNQYLELTGSGKVVEAARAFDALGQDLKALVEGNHQPAEALGSMGERAVDAVPTLIQAKQDQDEGTRNSTAGGLERTKKSQTETTDNTDFDF